MVNKISKNYPVTNQRLLSFKNFKKGLHNPRQALSAIKGQIVDRFPEDNYNKKYLSITSGIFEDAPPDLENREMGHWQFNFMKGQGLNREDYLLDIGCAYLRGGLHFIRYLDEGHYYGMDISHDALAEADRVIEEYDLEEKNPTVFRNFDLKFKDEQLDDDMFDFALAQSVFTHLPPDMIEECLANIHNVLRPGGALLATYYSSPDNTVKKFARAADFGYPFEFFEDVAQEYGLVVNEVEGDHPHEHNLLSFSVVE